MDYARPSAEIFWDAIAIIIEDKHFAAMEKYRAVIYNYDLVVLGRSMDVTGNESNAVAREFRTADNAVLTFSWPEGFSGMEN